MLLTSLFFTVYDLWIYQDLRTGINRRWQIQDLIMLVAIFSFHRRFAHWINWHTGKYEL
jgi:hypothetical protein